MLLVKNKNAFKEQSSVLDSFSENNVSLVLLK